MTNAKIGPSFVRKQSSKIVVDSNLMFSQQLNQKQNKKKPAEINGIFIALCSLFNWPVWIQHRSVEMTYDEMRFHSSYLNVLVINCSGNSFGIVIAIAIVGKLP